MCVTYHIGTEQPWPWIIAKDGFQRSARDGVFVGAEQVGAPPQLPSSQSIEAGVTQTNPLTPPRFFLLNLRSHHPQCRCATQDVDATSQTPQAERCYEHLEEAVQVTLSHTTQAEHWL